MIKRIKDAIDKAPNDYNYTEVLDIPCYINTIVDTQKSPYGDFQYYQDIDKTYLWRYKLDKVNLSNHYQKVSSMVYSNGVNSCEPVEMETVKIQDLLDEGQSISKGDVLSTSVNAFYSYSTDHKSTYFMIRIDMSDGIEPVLYNDLNFCNIQVIAKYDSDEGHIEKILTPQEDMQYIDTQKIPVHYRVVPYNNGFIIKFYNINYGALYKAYNYDFINNLNRDIAFTVDFKIRAKDKASLEDSFTQYICYPTVEEDTDDVLFIQAGTLTSEDRERLLDTEVIELTNNLKVTVAHLSNLETGESEDKVLGYIFRDFKFASEAYTDSYEILNNLIHEDVL